MKKFILLFAAVASIVATSCSEDDDGTSQDVIIGDWKLIQEFEDGELVASDACELQGVLSFEEDGTFSSIFFEEDVDGNCVQDDAAGTWENQGDNMYDITTNGGSVNTVEFVFSENTFSFTYSETFDDIIYTYRDVFTKI